MDRGCGALPMTTLLHISHWPGGNVAIDSHHCGVSSLSGYPASLLSVEVHIDEHLTDEAKLIEL